MSIAAGSCRTNGPSVQTTIIVPSTHSPMKAARCERKLSHVCCSCVRGGAVIACASSLRPGMLIAGRATVVAAAFALPKGCGSERAEFCAALMSANPHSRIQHAVQDVGDRVHEQHERRADHHDRQDHRDVLL